MNLFGLIPSGVLQAGAMANDPGMAERMAMASAMQAPEHKGLFGLKGTFRDVLGVLGDAFLLNEGRDPLYRAQRQQEKLGDAFQGFDQDPLGAIQRIGGVDAALGQKYYGDYLDSRDRQAKLAQDAQLEGYKGEGAFATRMGGLFGAANEKTYPALLANARKLAEARGYGHLLDGLPDVYDENAVKAWVRGTMAPKEQFDVDYRRTRLNQFDADREERIRHNKATEGTAARNAATSASRAATYRSSVDSANDYREWRKTNPLPSSSGRRRAPPPIIPPPPPGFKKQ